MKARSAAPVLMEYFRPAHAVGNDPRHRLDVVQEEALGVLAHLVHAGPAADLLHRVQEVHDLLGERGLRDAPPPGAEHLDLARERRGLVLVERADHVVRHRLVGIRVELAPGQAHDVGRVEPRVLGVDGDEELHDLARVQPVEEHRRDLDAEVLARLGHRVQGEQPVLAVEHAQDAVLLRDLEQAQVVLARHRGEGEALLGGDDDRAGDRGQGARVLAVAIVADQLVDLPADDRALVGGLALADPLLERFPVHARAVRALLALAGGLVRTSVPEHLELDQPVDILGGERRLKEFDPELLHAVRGNRHNRPFRLRGTRSLQWGSSPTLVEA